MPTWSIVPSRMWKAQVAYLSRHFRVVTFDGRGSGASGRPAGGGGVRRRGVRRRHPRGDGRRRDRPRRARLTLVRRYLVGARRGRAPGSRPRPVLDRAGLRIVDPRPGARGVRLVRAPPARPRLGQVQQAPLARGRLRRLPGLLLRADVLRAALDQADRGLRGLGERCLAADPGRHDRGPARLRRRDLHVGRAALPPGHAAR